MPVARFQMPDGRIARFEVPEGTSPEQAQAAIEESLKGSAQPAGMTRDQLVKRELLRSPIASVARGVKDVIDTGAYYLSALGGKDEQARVKAMNDAGKAEFDAAAEGAVMPKIGRIQGNLMAVVPAVNALGAGVATVAPRLGAAIQSGGFATGAKPAGMLARAGDMGIRVAGGAISGGASAGMVNPDDAKTGAVIGAVLPPAVKAVGEAGRAAAKITTNVLGLSTGVGSEPLKQAFKAGATKNQSFVDNIRGDVPFTDVLDDAKRGLEAMRQAKSTQYRSGMTPIKKDQTVLQFTDLDKALQDAKAVTAFKGQVKNERGAVAVQKMQDAIDQWKQLDPVQFHTPEGMDALKQKLAGILEEIPFGERSARLAAGKVHAAAKETINRQAPEYAKVMKDYQVASEQISEIERALSLGNKASADTAMRKLQSLMRNNVQTNYGNRLTLANTLEQQGGVDLMPALSGQALNSWTPRSLAGQAGAGATALTAMATGNLPLLAALPFQSPRLVGNALYQAGRLTGGAQQAAGTVAGRINQNALAAFANPDLAPAFYRTAPVLATAGR